VVGDPSFGLGKLSVLSEKDEGREADSWRCSAVVVALGSLIITPTRCPDVGTAPGQ
jgi:hypothetical protein